MTDRDVQIDDLRGVSTFRVKQAIDRLAAELGDDWIVIVSSDDLHTIARPTPAKPTRYIAGYGNTIPGSTR